MPNEYGTVAEMKSALGIGTGDAKDDASLALALESASRMIDDHCGRFFYKMPAVLQVNLDMSSMNKWHHLSFNADIATETGLVLTGSPDLVGWKLYLNLQEMPGGRPYTKFFSNGTAAPFVVGAGPAEGSGLLLINATFGWPEVPVAVKQATFIQAMRLHQRRYAPFGIAGSLEMGSEMRLLSRLDPDVEALLRPFVKGWYVA